MQIVNFGHPLSADHLAQLAELLAGQTIQQCHEVRTQVDQAAPFAAQARALVETVHWSPRQWQQNRFVIALPGLAPIAAAILAEVHGRCGYFPSILRLAPVGEAKPPVFRVAEIVDLAGIRDTARMER